MSSDVLWAKMIERFKQSKLIVQLRYIDPSCV